MTWWSSGSTCNRATEEFEVLSGRIIKTSGKTRIADAGESITIPRGADGRYLKGVARGVRRYCGAMAPVRQFQVTFDCAAPERVARFWCDALGYVIPPPPEGFADWNDFDRALPAEKQGAAFACVDPTGVGPRLFFQRVPEGKTVKNRVHLDVRIGTGLVGTDRLAALEAECARLVELGATRVRLLPAADGDESCIVMQDVEGNELCLD